MTTARELAEHHVAVFNECVREKDFGPLLAGFASDAQLRFENLPGPGILAYSGIAEIAAAYDQQPPDDEIDIAADPHHEGGTLVVPFTWRSGRQPGTMCLDHIGGLVARMVVIFGLRQDV